MYIIIALVTGSLVILSMITNSRLSEGVGIFQGVFINYVVGLVVSIIILLFNLKTVSIGGNIPWWAYAGGLFGLTVVALSNVLIPKIPTIYTTLLIFVGQLFTGMVIDFFTGNTISKGKVIGGILICAGLYYNLRVDKKELTGDSQRL